MMAQAILLDAYYMARTMTEERMPSYSNYSQSLLKAYNMGRR